MQKFWIALFRGAAFAVAALAALGAHGARAATVTVEFTAERVGGPTPSFGNGAAAARLPTLTGALVYDTDTRPDVGPDGERFRIVGFSFREMPLVGTPGANFVIFADGAAGDSMRAGQSFSQELENAPGMPIYVSDSIVLAFRGGPTDLADANALPTVVALSMFSEVWLTFTTVWLFNPKIERQGFVDFRVTSLQSTVAPLPGALPLLATGLACMALFRRRIARAHVAQAT